METRFSFFVHSDMKTDCDVIPGGYSEFQVTGMIEWGQKSKPKGLQTKPQKIPGPKINP